MGSTETHIGRLLCRSARYYPNKIAIIFNDRRVSYRDLNNRVNRLSNGLRRMGLNKGDKVALIFANQPEFIESFFAVIKAGATVVPLNFRLTVRELEYQIKDCDPKIVIYISDFDDRIESIQDTLKEDRTYVRCGKGVVPNNLDYEKLVTESCDSEPDVEIDGEGGCIIYYTAGTTGVPKGAFRTHHNVIWMTMAFTIAFDYHFDDIVSGFAPFFHLAGFEAFTLPAFLVGATVVISKGFDAHIALEKIDKEKISIIFLVPSMSSAILSVPNFDTYDLTSLRLYISAASPLTNKLKTAILERFLHVMLTESYGMTETGELTCMPSRDIVRKDMCVGIPAFHVRIRLVDDNGEDIPEGEVGEVIAKGPGIISKYYNDPERTQESIKDGWFYTGDLGKFDADGYLYLVDRKKDVVITGGENVYSAEVEGVICAHPKVLEAAVIGLPDEKWGEAVNAVLVLKPGETMSLEDLVAFCRKRLAGYKCPKGLFVLETQLPRNAFGKVVKRDLRKQFMGHRDS